MWIVAERNTFLQIIEDSGYNLRPLRRSKSDLFVLGSASEGDSALKNAPGEFATKGRSMDDPERASSVPDMWNVVVRNTFLQVTDDSVCDLRTLSRSKSCPCVVSFFDPASVDDCVSILAAREFAMKSPPVDESEMANSCLLELVWPSVGSAMHYQEECVPCTFFLKGSCRFEHTCKYCHFQHRPAPRPTKKTRDRRNKMAAIYAQGW